MLMHGTDRFIAGVPSDSSMFAADDMQHVRPCCGSTESLTMESLLCQADANVHCLQNRHSLTCLTQVEPLGVPM